jgi:hypothetical protein
MQCSRVEEELREARRRERRMAGKREGRVRVS